MCFLLFFYLNEAHHLPFKGCGYNSGILHVYTVFFPQHNSHPCLLYLYFFNVTNSAQTIPTHYAFNFLGRTLLYYTTFEILMYHNFHSMHMQRIATATRSGGPSELKLERFRKHLRMHPPDLLMLP